MKELGRVVQTVVEKLQELDRSFGIPTPPLQEDDEVSTTLPTSAPVRREILDQLFDEMRCTPSPPHEREFPADDVIDLTTKPIKRVAADVVFEADSRASPRSYTPPPEDQRASRL